VKENIVSFETKLTIPQVAGIFRSGVKRRPLKLRIVPFEFFTPTPADDPFADAFGSVSPDFEVGAMFSLPGPDPAMGSVILGCLSEEGCTRVMLTSTGNMRGRMVTNSLLKHLVDKIHDEDSTIAPETSTGRR
jgi:hypothetical protein